MFHKGCSPDNAACEGLNRPPARPARRRITSTNADLSSSRPPSWLQFGDQAGGDGHAVSNVGGQRPKAGALGFELLSRHMPDQPQKGVQIGGQGGTPIG
ncbi:hypothetical protein LRH25_13920 [Ideonella azotifigens]|uniref:hypothetical protein n=1 Tax=Ideonella azotifigens TaxID=513160 RepID=UPI001E2F45FA|nr:hypothetical protein [Ideonella azotifigens]MCD2341440.1 hypothetical protein [Ideonella azotifigens]